MQPQPKLEQLAENINYGDLGETWEVPNVHGFSADKALYGYQTDALRKAAQALFRYYRQSAKWQKAEAPAIETRRKRDFARLYTQGGKSLLDGFAVKNNRENHVFRILSEFIDPEDNVIPYHNLINRMCFWMATGSGKTLVMVKLIEYLYSLKRHGEIPQHDVLILAPGEQLLRQIRRTVAEFNFDPANKLKIDLRHLRDARRLRQTTIDDSTVVYYHDSRNISDVQKNLLTDYRTYERGGEWYVILDEAHKGGKENSKRQAYYAVMSRKGFLFNFSATFTDAEDILTTVKKYNLEDFVRNGHGKNIYLNKAEYGHFKIRDQEINHAERLRIVLKSLVTLAYLSGRVREVRQRAGREDIYHLPLMLTLANSVNPRAGGGGQNDLWEFFKVLRQIAANEIDESVFAAAKAELAAEWRNAEFIFKTDGGVVLHGGDEAAIVKMSMAKLREAVFFSRKPGALEYIQNAKKKTELAFKSKGADAPFALVSIGDTSNWRRELLREYEDTSALHDKGFFESLDENQIMILMGSRKFIESWDTNRPNVINFINIGSRDAKKYVMQSIGRGVRIEPISNQRRRLSYLALEGAEAQSMRQIENRVHPIETLFLFATNRADIESVLNGIKEAEEAAFQPLFGFEIAKRAASDGKELPLLVPEYHEASDDSVRPPFAMSASAQRRFTTWVNATSDSVFAVRDGLDAGEICALRETLKTAKKIKTAEEKKYPHLALLQERVVSHNAQKSKVSDSVRKLDEDRDIVHFRNIRVHPEYADGLRKKVESVKEQVKTYEETAAALPAGKRLAFEKGIKVGDTFQGAAGQGVLKLTRIAGHYYLPMILWENEKPDYMQHIISAESEIRFVNALEEWVKNNLAEASKWTWMFSKIDESLDKVYIPYYDNAARKFFPDFVFWMWRGGEYRIVFVDPKGLEHTSAYTKIDGYVRIFEEKNAPRIFPYRKEGLQVRVELLMFNPKTSLSEKYKKYWIDTPARIFGAS